MTTKTLRPVRHRYANGLTYSWLTDSVPEQGAYYKGCTSRLEADRDTLWGGHKSALLAVRNRKLNAVICTSTDGSAFSGALSSALRDVMACRYELTVTSFVPIEMRQSRWSCYNHRKLEGLDVVPVMVDRVTEQHIDCDLATLIPDVHARMERVLKQELRRRFCNISYWNFQGFWVGENRLNCYADPLVYPRTTFPLLGIPFKPEWDQKVAVHKAKQKLSQV